MWKHAAPAAAFKSVAPNEFWLFFLKVAKPAEIETPRPAIVQSGWLASQIFCPAGDPRPHEMLAKVMADVAAGVCEPIWVKPRLGEQQQACGFECRCRQNDNFG